MNIIIRRKAADDLERIFAWIAEDNPSAARVVVQRLRDRIARLATPGLEHMGRPRLIENTRELIEPPYIIVYKVDDDHQQVEIMAVFHAAQDRPKP